MNTSNSVIATRGHALKIIWPDGDVTDLGGAIVGGIGGTITRLEFQGKESWQPTSPGTYTITVEWTPEDAATCIMEFEVNFFR